MSQMAIDSFSLTRQVADPRADGGTRVVHVSAKQIVIERTLQKVRMRVAVPVASYQGLIIAARLQAGTATLELRHEDPDLDVTLASGDAIEVAQKAKAWRALFDKDITIEDVCVPIFEPFARLRHRIKASRRSRFSRQRKAGFASRMTTSFGGEHEIIART